MSSGGTEMERHAKTLRAWRLALLRFAVTLDNADRLAVLMIAAEIDRLGARQDNTSGFSFFRHTSAELCAAILRPNSPAATVLRQHLARIDDDRLRRSFTAALETDQSKAPSASIQVKRDNGLWKGLGSRSNRLV